MVNVGAADCTSETIIIELSFNDLQDSEYVTYSLIRRLESF
jgi:hypothetical protein